MYEDKNWLRAATWLSDATLDANAKARLGVLGAGVCLGSITPGRCDVTPRAVREVLKRFSTFDIEHNVEVSTLTARDYGDAAVSAMSPAEAFAPLSSAAEKALREVEALVLIGGDNSITRGGVHAMMRAARHQDLKRCGLLTLDAHLDLRDTANGLTNGNPVRALIEDGLPGKHISQIGIQSFANSRRYYDVAREHNITVITANQARQYGVVNAVHEQLLRLSELADAIYVDCDLDVLERTFAPATPGARPGGLMPHDIKEAIYLCGMCERVRALDLVEIDATKDIADITVMTAAACLMSFTAGLTQRAA